MMRTRTTLLALALALAAARPALADATVFLGPNLTPSNRLTKGVAVEAGLLVVGFEFEYAVTSEDLSARAPSLKTGMGNVLLQTPFPIFGFQPYVTGGVGVYQEELGARGDTGFGANTGGGLKIALVGPLRLRVDYRVFRLGSGALESPAHRIYAGLNLAF
jgi:hypothetical protein